VKNATLGEEERKGKGQVRVIGIRVSGMPFPNFLCLNFVNCIPTRVKASSERHARLPRISTFFPSSHTRSATLSKVAFEPASRRSSAVGLSMSTPTRSDPLSLSLSLSQRCAARRARSVRNYARIVSYKRKLVNTTRRKTRAPHRESFLPRVKISFEVGDSHPEEDRAAEY